MNQHDIENEGMRSLSEVAELMNCSPQTILNIQNKAMEKIRSTRPELRDYLIELTEEKQ